MHKLQIIIKTDVHKQNNYHDVDFHSDDYLILISEKHFILEKIKNMWQVKVRSNVEVTRPK